MANSIELCSGELIISCPVLRKSTSLWLCRKRANLYALIETEHLYKHLPRQNNIAYLGSGHLYRNEHNGMILLGEITILPCCHMLRPLR